MFDPFFLKIDQVAVTQLLIGLITALKKQRFLGRDRCQLAQQSTGYDATRPVVSRSINGEAISSITFYNDKSFSPLIEINAFVGTDVLKFTIGKNVKNGRVGRWMKSGSRRDLSAAWGAVTDVYCTELEVKTAHFDD